MAEPAAGTLLGVFARYWTPGKVKTRLARRIGNESAARLHRQFVETTLSRLAGIAAQQWLAATPGETVALIAAECACVRTWQVVPQTDGDLGERMQSFFRDASRGADRVVLIGSDSPDLPRAYVEQAFAELSRAPVVLGPAADGGYYLIGIAAKLLASRDASFLFEAMPWSRPELLSTTLSKLEQRNIGCRLLRSWRDVDDWSDLMELGRRLAEKQFVPDQALADLQAAVKSVISFNLPEQPIHD